MAELLRRFWREEEGQGITEYSLILVLVVVVIWVAVRNTNLNQALANLWTNVGNNVNNPTN